MRPGGPGAYDPSAQPGGPGPYDPSAQPGGPGPYDASAQPGGPGAYDASAQPSTDETGFHAFPVPPGGAASHMHDRSAPYDGPGSYGLPGQAPVGGPGASGGQGGPPSGEAGGGTGGSKRRTALVAAAAVLACLLTTAAHTYDGHVFYEKVAEEETRETVVPAGQAGKVNGIEWRAAVERMKPPASSTHGPEVTWLKVDITKKAVDEKSVTMVAEPRDVQVQDRSGRTWTVPIEPVGDRPTDKLVVGREYKIQGAAIVPTAVADEVELSFRPSNYRSDTPVDDLFTREGAEKLVPDVDVLRFKRR